MAWKDPSGTEGGTPFVPITPNPFIVGNPVRERSMFFGREAEFDLVRRRFRPPARGGLLVFCGERRSGKTSILFQILDGRLGPEFLPVLIDMQSMAIENEVDFLGKVASEILETLTPEECASVAPPDFGAAPKPCAAFLKFTAELRRAFPDQTPVLLFDEYELLGTKIEAGILSEDILMMLSNMMELHSVSLVFTGSQDIGERRQPYWRILGKSLYRVISYLQPDDAAKLIQRPVEGKVRYEDGVFERICRLTSGQPFYTQAICQNLIDHLNERRTSTADIGCVETVIREIVDNPFPQMIFLWDSFERDEKIALSVLAETLRESDGYATVTALLQALKTGGYSVRIGRARLATALEGLFKKDFLLKDTEVTAGYAFRMDLWRLWVRRMHSVWQVLREEGMVVGHGPVRHRTRSALLASAALLCVLGLFSVVSFRREAPVPPEPSRVEQSALALVDLRIEPPQAAIRMDENPIGMGSFRGPVSVDQEHRFRVRSEGYAETTLLVVPAAGETLARRIALRPLFGDLHIVTDPPGAQITVDGDPAGQSPLTVSALEVPRRHQIGAMLPGYAHAQATCDVQSGTLTTLRLILPRERASLLLKTEPPGAEVRARGASQGRTPLLLRDLPTGRFSFRVDLLGYSLVDTSALLAEGEQTLAIALREESPAVLLITGDSPSDMYLDGVLLKESVLTSGRRELRPGRHRLQIITGTGRTVEDTVDLKSGEFAVYDHAARRLIRRDPAGK